MFEVQTKNKKQRKQTILLSGRIVLFVLIFVEGPIWQEAHVVIRVELG